MREVRYNKSSSGWPAIPDENSTLYTGEIPYENCYIKAIAREDNDWSAVTSKSFGMGVVTDYIAYYQLLSDYKDVSDFKRDGILSGSGNFEQGGVILSAGSGISIPTIIVDTINSNQLGTISIWVKEKSMTQLGCPFNLQGGNNNHFPWSDSNYYISTFSSARHSIPATLPSDRTKWTHYVITSEWKMYVDGVLLSTQSKSPFSIPAANSVIGASAYGIKDAWFKNCRIYNREITQSEVTQIFNAGQ